jgi:hypothetical protein
MSDANKGQAVGREQFDFVAWEKLIEGLPAGMQMWMASDLLTRAGLSMMRFRNPRGRTALDLADNTNSLRIAVKADRAARDADKSAEPQSDSKKI